MHEARSAPPALSTDENLLGRIAERDQAAFAELYDRHAARLLGLLVRWFTNRSDAEDVLQDLFWQVWSRAEQYSPKRGTVTVWLYLLARSRSMDYLRRHSQPVPLRDWEPPVFDDASTSLARREQAKVVRNALDRLPQPQRRAIHLAFFCGLTHEQIAQQEGIPLGTAKTRIWLALRRLRGLLGE
jgi:RNA polymerase sigma-70 factor (ECF subfamily)